MEKQAKNREADLVTGIIIFTLGVWIVGSALQMPLTGSLSGVTNYWYTSPALLPLFIGSMLIILSVSLFIIAYKAGAVKGLSQRFGNITMKISPLNLRVIITMAYILGFVYLYVPHIDFFLNIIFFLSVFMISFYLEKQEILYRTALFVLPGAILFCILIFSGLGGALRNVFSYSLDVLQLIQIIVLAIFTRKNTTHDLEAIKKLRTVWVVAILVPAVLIPIFRFGLRVPLPNEGGIIQLLNLVVRSLR